MIVNYMGTVYNNLFGTNLCTREGMIISLSPVSSSINDIGKEGAVK